MSNNRRQSTLNAINKYIQRQSGGEQRQARAPNTAPEKDVEKECLIWMRARGWSVQIFEAKATWNPQAQVWMQQGMKAGTCDCIGTTDEGIGAFIEFKAPGKLATFNKEGNYLQREFIVTKIEANAFSCVVDSANRLELIFLEWTRLRALNKDSAKEYLKSMLPVISEKTRLKRDKLFDDE